LCCGSLPDKKRVEEDGLDSSFEASGRIKLVRLLFFFFSILLKEKRKEKKKVAHYLIYSYSKPFFSMLYKDLKHKASLNSSVN
jgi:hypothetical protein